MIEKRLEEHLTDFYHGQELRPQKLAELLALGENRWTRREMARVRTPAPWSWHRMFVHGRVAAAVSLLLLGAFYLGRTSRPAVPGELTMNHKKQLDMEVSAGDYAALQTQMNKLDFALELPRSATAVPLHVVGARYCSIQGQLAAQIRVRDSAGTVYTLYETKLTDKLSAVSGEVKTEGVRIRLWREDGLFFGLAVSERQSE